MHRNWDLSLCFGPTRLLSRVDGTYFADREGKASQPEVIGRLSRPPDSIRPGLLGCKRGPVWDRNRLPSRLSSAPHWNWQNCFNRGRGGGQVASLCSVTCRTCVIRAEFCFTAKSYRYIMFASWYGKGSLQFFVRRKSVRHESNASWASWSSSARFMLLDLFDLRIQRINSSITFVVD
jgi:hypothetical protein